MAANPDVQIIEDNPPPRPALKKRATKRGLSKLASDVPEDAPDIQSHVTNVYSSCVQRSTLLLSNMLRKPLFSKQSDNTDKAPSEPPFSKQSDDADKPPEPEDVPETQTTRRPRRKVCVSNTPSTSSIVGLDDLDEDENSLQSTEDVSIIRSPSPPVPPPPPTRFPSKRRWVSKAMKDAFRAIDSIKGELRKGIQTSPQTPPVVIVDSPVQNDSQLVRVRYINDIHRFSMSKSDMFYSLQTQMADVLGVRVEQIGLYLNDSRLASSDTPLSIRLHLADIIVCHILVAKQGDSDEEETYSTDNIKVQMQCRNSRQKTSMIVKKFLPLKFMMEKYAQKQGKPLEALQFHFDGELLQPEMMPNDVELDDDDTIDVVEMK